MARDIFFPNPDRRSGLAAHRITRSVVITRSCVAATAFTPAVNDEPFGDGLFAAMQRAIAAHGAGAGQALAMAAQRAFWRSDITGCRWWRSVGRMVDRRLSATQPDGGVLLRSNILAVNDNGADAGAGITRR